MSYCVNCGVELAASEKRCPLCGVEVLNPREPFDELAARPFPADVEKVRHRLVRVTAAQVFSLLLAIPLISILLVDLIQDGALTWSLIPTAAMVCAFLAVVLPCLFKRPIVWLFMILGVAETVLLLFVLKVILGGDWLWLFALPITLLTGAAVIGGYLMIRSRRAPLALKVVIILLILAVYIIVLQMLIEIHLHGRIRIDWSLYAAIPCGMLSLVALIIGRLVRKNEAFRKKMFF